MKLRLLALAPLLLLCACSTVCPPAPANTMPDSPFRNYRLSSLIITTTDFPNRPFSQEILDTEFPLSYRPRDYPLVENILHDAFSKSGDKDYATAPALHMVCSVETAQQHPSGFFNLMPAKFVGKISIVDPGTKRTLVYKQCDFDASTMPGAKAEECSQRDLPGLSDVIHQCLRQFAPEMRSIILKPQPNKDALLDGTFVGVVGSFTPNPPTFLEKISNSKRKKDYDTILDRLVSYELPTNLSTSFMDNNPFSNAASNTYGVKIDVSESDLSAGFISPLKMRYTSVTTILKNGKPVGSFTYKSSQSTLRERTTLYASHMQAILEYLRDHAAEIDKK